MNKTDLASVISAIVLSAGLVSCSKDQKTRDVYKAPVPVIITSKGSQDLLKWDRSSDKTLDLQSSFDVSAGNPVRLEVIARCTRDKINIVENFTLNGRRPVKIFQVIPQELLFEDLSVMPVECAWELTLFNEAGSRHIMMISTAPIAGKDIAGVLIETGTPDEKIKSLHALKMTGVKIRYRNQGAASAEVICRDLTFYPLQFERVLDMNQFDLRKPLVRQGKPETIAQEKPLQPCRIAITEAGSLRQISPLIQIQIPRRPLEMSIKQILPQKLNHLQMPSVMAAKTLYAEVLVKNPDAASRSLRLPKTYVTKLDAVLYHNVGLNRVRVNERTVIHVPWMQSQIVKTQGEVKDGGGTWAITLPAHGELLFQIFFESKAKGCFRQEVYFDNYTITPAPLPLTEISQTNEVIEINSIEVSPTGFWAKEAYENLPQFDRGCL